jgi:DNA polymerase III alpha subunit (gram-positive type)
MSGFLTSQVFLAVDIEADGPQPGKNSMLSLAAVATDQTHNLGEFYRKLSPIPDGKQNSQTMVWWSKNPESYQEATSDQESPEIVIKDFVKWCQQFDSPIFVSHPATYDFTIVSWYLEQYYGKNIFQTTSMMNALDLPSYSAGKFDLDLAKSYRSQLPDYLRKGMAEHTHRAIDDARGLAAMLRNILSAKGMQNG